MQLALRRLPWYIAFCVIVGPVILAPFTAGASLAWYYFYFAIPFGNSTVPTFVTWAPVLIGIFIWSLRVFIAAFTRHWFRDHLQGIETGRILYQRIRGGAVWSEEIEREVDSREVTLALLSPGSYRSDLCRAEQLRALDKGNRVIPVLAVTNSDRPIYLYTRQYVDFTNYAYYTSQLDELIADIRCEDTARIPDIWPARRRSSSSWQLCWMCRECAETVA